MSKVDKTIGLLCKLQAVLPHHIIYDQAYKESFHQKLESIQYNAALAITGAIIGTSREKLYQELGLEPPKK